MNYYLKRIGVAIVALFMLQSCGSYKLDDAQNSIRESFAARNFANTAAMVEKFKQDEVYKDKDRVLYYLELGTSSHFAGNYQKSVQAFSDAEFAIDDEFTKSIKRGAKSILMNDNQLAYDGEPYEDVYANAFKALDFLHQGDLEGAKVEARRMAYKMENLDTKYKGLAESMNQTKEAEDDTTTFRTGKLNIQNSALSHYLAASVFAKQGNPDNARIESAKFKVAMGEQSTLYNLPVIDQEFIDQVQNPSSYNVMLIAFAGRGPIKVQNDLRINVEGKDGDSEFYVKYSLPELKKIPSTVNRIHVIVDGGEPISLFMVEKMEDIVEEIYNVKLPIIKARTIARATAKAIAAKIAQDKAAEKDETMGQIVGLLGAVTQEATEKADLRGWQTLPAKAYTQLINLEPGTHELKIEYISDLGTTVFSETKTVEVGESPSELKLVESLYWN